MTAPDHAGAIHDMMESWQSVDERAVGFAVTHVERRETRPFKGRVLARSVDLGVRGACRKDIGAQREKAFRDRRADA